MTTPADTPFTADVVAAVVRHRNEDHAEDSLVIRRALGGAPDATRAVLVALDDTGLDLGRHHRRVPRCAPRWCASARRPVGCSGPRTGTGDATRPAPPGRRRRRRG
ncbi:DUF2470 domain-containing protein, partial [Actinoalloteichus caeruleus]|uniref:DUF2470 domain-containing protein n=1 Tax=Actinoalloteichus cyanogriseus TaxID=2893586 RepID=UPI003AA9B82A